MAIHNDGTAAAPGTVCQPAEAYGHPATQGAQAI